MNWINQPYLYQLFHPWHWLTYGQNAAAAGFIGLAAYVAYTRRMMVAAEETRRLSLTPHLLAEISDKMGPLQFEITNVAGPAVRCEIWLQKVSAYFTLTGHRLIRKPNVEIYENKPSITQASPIYIPIMLEAHVLYVIDCHDTASGDYQLQILQARDNDGRTLIHNIFVVPDTFLPFWKRWINRLRQKRQLRQLARR
jgi:hypothetical protein